MNFPIFHNMTINFPDGYLGKQIYFKEVHNTIYTMVKEVDEFALMPSLNGNKLYLDFLSAQFYINRNLLSGEPNHIVSSQLEVISNDINITFDPISIDNLSTETGADYLQNLFFVTSEMPLFELVNLTNNQDINITFKITSIDSNSKIIINSAHFLFFYRNRTKDDDVNGDGNTDIIDVVKLSNQLLNRDNDNKYGNYGILNNANNIKEEDVMALANRVLEHE